MEIPNLDPRIMASIGARTMVTFKRMRKILHAAMQEEGIDMTMEQFVMMSMIHDEVCVSQTLIAECLHLNKSSVMRMIDTLEKKGYVERVADPNDRRINLLELTEAGEASRQQVIEFHVAYRLRMEKGITDAERETYLKVLQKLRTNSEAVQASFGEK